ncbi:MAG TPA: hypothetical protein VIG66_04620 [Noviherbaspirillum sp.]
MKAIYKGRVYSLSIKPADHQPVLRQDLQSKEAATFMQEIGDQLIADTPAVFKACRSMATRASSNAPSTIRTCACT